MLDVGTGSGVLAIAAARLGAARAAGIDTMRTRSSRRARTSRSTPRPAASSFDVVDLAAAALPPADVVTANLTGALLVRAAAALLAAVRPGGTLIVSGLLAEERETVPRRVSRPKVVWEAEEDGWVGPRDRQVKKS